MRLTYRNLILSVAAVLFLQEANMQAVELQLSVPSYEQCLEKSHTLGQKLTCAKYARAAALTVSTFLAIYTIYDFFWGIETPQKEITIPPVRSWFSLETAQKAGWWLAKGCAYTICTQWVAHKLTLDRSSPKHFIAQHVAGYKNHDAEIERLISIRVQHVRRSFSEGGSTECLDIDLAIQAHLQQLINKIELFMAYMIYYAAAQTPEKTAAQVDLYAQEVLKKVAHAAEQYNATYVATFESAVTECKDACVKQLISAIRYALTILPRD